MKTEDKVMVILRPADGDLNYQTEWVHGGKGWMVTDTGTLHVYVEEAFDGPNTHGGGAIASFASGMWIGVKRASSTKAPSQGEK